MSDISIFVGKGAIDSTSIGYRKLMGFYLSCTVFYNRRISLDFLGLKWINGNMCALFTAILHKLNRENGLTFDINKANYSYIKDNLSLLFRNGFLQDIIRTPYLKSSVILSVFGKDEDSKFIDYIEKQLLGNIGMKIKEEQKQDMIDNFLEVFSNVQLHARTEEPVFACGQHFPHEGKLHFTLVDVGVGYLPPIKEFTNGEIKTAEHAIIWALNDKNTTKKDAPGGMGLKNLLKYCNETKGELSIITGDTFWNNKFKMGPISVPPFCGTSIHLIFNCNN